jgi:predicted RNase H-like HicB family nuclease
MRDHTYQVKAVWDDEAGVWVASSDDVPGLVTEAATVEELVKKLEVLIPELLEANNALPHAREIPFEVLSERHATARLRA